MNERQVKLFESLEGWDEFYGKFSSFYIKNLERIKIKLKLLELARNGAEKPRRSKGKYKNKLHLLANALKSYTSKESNAYDAYFDADIRKIAPNWFVSTALSKKELLLKMARNGEPKPNCTHPLWSAFHCYTTKSQNSYNASFDADIRKIAPHWFADSVAINKELLLKMARDGEPKPTGNLWIICLSYTTKTRRYYDPHFDKTIKKTAPHWFVNSADERKKNKMTKKEKLIRSAEKGDEKPPKELRTVLTSYTCSFTKNYDPIFDKQIRKLAPKWFRESSVQLKKEELIRLAKTGASRPSSRTHPLGCMLIHYTNEKSKCYDSVFDKQIRKLAPHWFKK